MRDIHSIGQAFKIISEMTAKKKKPISVRFNPDLIKKMKESSPRVIVTFKSIPEMFEKEKSGIKPNTFRKIQKDDYRFIALRMGIVKRISIHLPDISDMFEREITDYTEWDGYAIISWKQLEKEGKK